MKEDLSKAAVIEDEFLRDPLGKRETLIVTLDLTTAHKVKKGEKNSHWMDFLGFVGSADLFFTLLMSLGL